MNTHKDHLERNPLKSIRSLCEAYQIIFTNNLHKTIKLLTTLTIILSIPTMISSVYGMIVMLFTAILFACGLGVVKKGEWVL